MRNTMLPALGAGSMYFRAAKVRKVVQHNRVGGVDSWVAEKAHTHTERPRAFSQTTVQYLCTKDAWGYHL